MSFNGSKSGITDTKNFRINILQKANQRLGVIVKGISEGNGTQVNKNSGMLSLLDNYYKSDVPSTNYSMHLKAVAFESARSLIIAENTKDDIYFKTTRGEYLSQNIASFLFPFSRFPTTDKTDNESRNFYLAIIEAYFGGSTKNNIEKSLIRFLDGVDIGILENFLLARSGGSLDPILNKFTFDVLVNVSDARIKDVNKLQNDIEFLLSIIKPAHTTFQTKLIFSEFFDVFRNICSYLTDGNGERVVSPDGFEIKIKGTNTSICDTYHIDLYDYYYEDLRKPSTTFGISQIDGEIVQDNNLKFFQASPRVPISTLGGNWDLSDVRQFHTKYGPYAKPDGNIADSVEDIKVYVDGIQVDVLNIFPLSGAFTLVVNPSDESVVTVDYKVVRNFTGALITNDADSVINNFRNSGTEHNYSNVLPPTGFNPVGENPDYNVWEQSIRYKGFDLFNSSVLNNPLTLNLNEADSRSRLNDYNVFKSFGYDFDQYNTKLREDTPLFPVSLDLKDFARRLYQQEIILNNTEYAMNTTEDRMFGEIHQQSYHPFYSALEIESVNNGGNIGILTTIEEDPISGLQIDFGRAFEDFIPRLGQDYDCQFYTFPSGSGFINASGFESYSAADLVASGYATLTNDTNCVIFGGSGSWDISESPTNQWNSFDPVADSYPLVPMVNYHFGGNHGQMHILVNDVHLENYTKLEALDSLPYVIEEVKDIPYENLITLSYNQIIDARSFRIRDFKKPLSLTFQVNYPIHCLDNSEATAIKTVELSSITSVKNIRNEYDNDNNIVNTLIQDYDIANLILFGDKVYQLDESNLTNINIGYQSGDEVLISYTTTSKMNDHQELVRQIAPLNEIKFITAEPIHSIISVYNSTKSQFYDISNYEILGDRVINLRKDSLINQGIGFNLSDIVIVDYVKINTIREVVPLTALSGNFLKFEINSPHEIITAYQVKNISKGQFYDLTNLSVLNTNIILLADSSLRNILIGQDFGDTFEIEMIALSGFTIISGEIVEVVNSPYRFRFINVKGLGELVSLTNVTLQQKYDLTDFSNLIVSSGEESATNILLKGDTTTDSENINKRWSSVGSSDSIAETILVKFNTPKNIDIVTLVGHNWKEYKITYLKNGILTDFSTPISVTNNTSDRTSHKFDEVNTTEILITIQKTINPNENKHLTKLIYMLENIIELDYTSVINHRIGVDFGDIIYSSSIPSLEFNGIEPWLTTPRPNYNRSVFEILPV